MISPSGSLIAIAAVVILPALTIGGELPNLLPPCLALVALLAIASAIDAMRGLTGGRQISVAEEQSLKLFKGREFKISVKFGASGLRAGIELPSGLSSKTPVVALDTQGVAVFSVIAEERGRYEITRAFLSAVSPWRLWRTRFETPLKIDIRVFPDLEKERGAKLLFLRKQGGLRTLRIVGRGRDFERMRDYAPGDSFDEIAWKATARRGKPIVRVFQVERTQDVYVVVDSSRLSARGDALEQFVSASLMLALATENQGDNFGLVTFSGGVDHFVSPGRGRAHFARCRDTIFDLKPASVSPDFAEILTFLQLRIRRRSLLLFLTDLSDSMLAEAFLRDVRMLSRRHVVLVNRLNDDEVRPVFPEPCRRARTTSICAWRAI